MNNRVARVLLLTGPADSKTPPISRFHPLSPLRVGEGEDRTFYVASERSDHAPLHEVEEVNLAVHATGYSRVKVGDVAHAGYSARVQRQGVVSVEVGGLASVLETYVYVWIVSRAHCVWLFSSFFVGLIGQVNSRKQPLSWGPLRQRHVASYVASTVWHRYTSLPVTMSWKDRYNMNN